jgi:hypothetical protein
VAGVRFVSNYFAVSGGKNTVIARLIPTSAAIVTGPFFASPFTSNGT